MVVFAQRHQEHDGGDIFKAVDPLASLRPLATHVHHSGTEKSNRLLSTNDGINHADSTRDDRQQTKCSGVPKYDALQVKRVLDDACGGHSDPQHILLRGHVRQVSNPIQRIQVAEKVQRDFSLKKSSWF